MSLRRPAERRPLRARSILPLLAALLAACSTGVGTRQAPAADGADVARRIAVFERGLRPAAGTAGADPDARWSLAERMAHYGVPGLSVAVIDDGAVAWARGYGVKQAGTADSVDAGTVFSVGSVSKVGAAAATLRLVDRGVLDLDRPVNDYLSRWEVPDNELTARSPVTLRRILSHTAGLTVHGFADYQPGEALPTLVQILEGAPPAKSAPVLVDVEPGTLWRYSGGGTTVEQLVIEEVTGKPFAEAARELVFEPLGMRRSTYVNPIPASHGNIARAHDRTGAPAALPRGWEAMPEAAASGLWTTPSDYARLVIALIDAYRGEGDFLSPALARDVMTEVAPGTFGLGPELTGSGTTRRFRHGGANDSYRAWMEGHLATGDGVVVFTNGTRGGDLIAEVVLAVADAEGWEVVPGR